MAEPARTAYETVIYPGYAYVQTHPDHLAALSKLCGLEPAPLETCRVLEIGCGDAANLLPMACALPRASFYGFDLAAASIERGHMLVRELGISNLKLEHLDICQAPDKLGEFDYIIAHGFYSWVPQAARDKLMAICRGSLAPQGVAFVSYNALPGGHIRRMIREMMLFHVECAPSAEEKIKQARALIGFLSNLSQGDDEYQLVLKKELERVYKYPPGYLYHDDLAPISQPFYFYEFIDQAARYGLQFVGDLNSSFVHLGKISAEGARLLAALDEDPLRREQYLDFACCRRFRQTLLCHEGLRVEHHLDPRRLEGLLISSAAVPVSSEMSLASGIEEEFRGARNTSLKTAHPVVKAAITALSSVWPERLSIEELGEQVAALLDTRLDSISLDLLSQGILAGFSLRVLDLHVYSPSATCRPGSHPRTTALIRLQARNGAVLTNLLHQSVKVEGDAMQLLLLLDGERNREDLAAAVKTTPAQVDKALAQLARMALLEA
jgi:methyltransferase-like protein